MRIALSITAVALGWLAAGAEVSSLDAGRHFTAQLKLDLKTDTPLFEQMGFERSRELLSAVMSRGQSLAATPAEWAEMHRATSGLIELHEHKGQLFKASVYATFQSGFYRTYERDHEASLTAARQALDLQLRSGELGGISICHATIGRSLLTLGRFDEALLSLREAQSHDEEPTRIWSADLWRDIIAAELARGNKQKARQESERMLEFARSASPALKAMALLGRSDVELDEGRFQDVVVTGKEALAVVAGDKDADRVGMDVALQFMSCVLASMRTLPYGEALKLAKQMDTETPNLLFQVAPLARRAIQVRRRLSGDIEGVLKEDLVRLEQARQSRNVRLQIEILRSLGASYASVNAVLPRKQVLEEALDLEETLRQAGAAVSSTGLHWFLGNLNSLGQAYLDNNEIGKARKCFDRVIAEFEKITAGAEQRRMAGHRNEALLAKARIAELDDDSDTARDLIARVIKEGGDDAAQLQLARLERGEHPDRAAELYETSIASIRKGGDRGHEIWVRLEFAKFLATIGFKKVPEAGARVAEQLGIVSATARANNYADALWRVEFVAGLLAEAAKEKANAIRHYQAAITQLDQIRAGLTQQDQRQSFMDSAAAQELYRRLVALLAEDGHKEQAWQYLELGKARSFVEMLKGRQFRLDEKAPEVTELRTIEKQIVDLRSQLAPENAAALRGGTRGPEVLRGQLRTLEQKFTVARQAAALTQGRAGEALSVKPPTLEEIRSKLPPQATLVEYGILEDRLMATVVSRGAIQQAAWQMKSRDLRRAVGRLTAQLASPESKDLAPAISELSAMVLTPIAGLLPEPGSRLIIVPAGSLNYVPFQTLVTASGKTVIDQYTISYLPSASTLKFLKASGTAKPDGSDLFLGALGEVAVDGMSPLPGTLVETDGIAKLYPAAARASAAEFTHDRAVEALTRFERVHFATHGLVDEQSPLFSALLTSPSDGRPARLSLYELTDLKLRARLVVLSACETGLGRLLGGDEVAGLTRTFLIAGADTVVSSLWKVSDESTALLMESFHRELRDGKHPAEAMRAAAFAVREKYPHPFFWAPFIATGAL